MPNPDAAAPVAEGFASHPKFTLPRVPAGRYVTLHLYPSDDPRRHQGLFVTSGCENLGSEDEIYVLRRVQAPYAPAEFIKVPRHWQENGYLTVYEMRLDDRYSASSTNTPRNQRRN